MTPTTDHDLLVRLDEKVDTLLINLETAAGYPGFPRCAGRGEKIKGMMATIKASRFLIYTLFGIWGTVAAIAVIAVVSR